MTYRILRLDWGAAEKMSAKLNELLTKRERVVSISATNDEVVVLVEDHDEH